MHGTSAIVRPTLAQDPAYRPTRLSTVLTLKRQAELVPFATALVYLAETLDWTGLAVEWPPHTGTRVG